MSKTKRVEHVSEKSAEAWDAEAKERYDAAEESFQRCDTDGFLSQWASNLSGQKAQAMAAIARDGGTAEFPGLFRKSDGKRVRAKLIQSKYGWCWALCDASGNFTGTFLPSGKRSRKLKAAGLEERDERAPANAKIAGRGTGLSGTCWVEVYRTDSGYPADAEVL